MAANLAAAGFELTVWNRSAAKAEQLASSAGAAVATSPRDLAQTSDIVITMLADDRASAEVHHGRDGLFAATAGATHFVEMGTLSPSHVRTLASGAGERTVVDAPVSGSTDAAAKAHLMIMVGADDATIAPLRPVLEALGRDIICLGTCGSGATMKLAVNLMIHGLNEMVAESLMLAEAAGIEPATAYEALEKSAAAAPMLTYRKPQYLSEGSSPVTFSLSLARKDVAVALDLAHQLGVDMPQGRVNLAQLEAAEAAGWGEHDMAAVLSYLRGEG